MIQRLEGHAGGQGAIADDGHDAAVLPALCSRDSHAERGADRGAGMTHAEGVVFAFAAARKRREPLMLLDGMQPLAAPGQHFMRVGLVADVPHQPVIGGVENIMQGDGQFDRAQSRREVAAAGTDTMDQELAQLIGQFHQLGRGQQPQVRRCLERLKQRVLLGRGGHPVQFIQSRVRTGNDPVRSLQNCHAVAAIGLRRYSLASLSAFRPAASRRP